MSEPRDEREFTTDLEVRTPPWLPGGKLAVHYRRLWDKRANDFMSQTAEAANIDEEELLHRIGEGDSFSNVFQKASRQIIEDGDPVLHDTLTRLVAAALHDDARIDDISYILTKLDGLQPVHIRIIAALPGFSNYSLLSRTEISERVNASVGVVASALGDLENKYFVESSGGEQFVTKFTLGELGKVLRYLIGEVDKRNAAEQRTGGRKRSWFENLGTTKQYEHPRQSGRYNKR